jgi:hypothetical protein
MSPEQAQLLDLVRLPELLDTDHCGSVLNRTKDQILRLIKAGLLPAAGNPAKNAHIVVSRRVLERKCADPKWLNQIVNFEYKFNHLKNAKKLKRAGDSPPKKKRRPSGGSSPMDTPYDAQIDPPETPEV